MPKARKLLSSREDEKDFSLLNEMKSKSTRDRRARILLGSQKFYKKDALGGVL